MRRPTYPSGARTRPPTGRQWREKQQEALRLAAQHGLLTLEEVERWFLCRDNRNDTAHDYGEAFAQETLALMAGFIHDAYALAARLHTGDQDTGGST